MSSSMCATTTLPSLVSNETNNLAYTHPSNYKRGVG